MWEAYASLFWAKVEKTDGCWWWRGARRSPSRGENSYGVVRWSGKRWSAHRVSYEMTHGEVSNGLHVLHECDHPLCVNPTHLFLGTAKANCEDRTSKNRQARGEGHGRSKLTAADVVAMRNAYVNTDLTMRDIGASFGVCQATARQAINGDHWTEVPMLTQLQISKAMARRRSLVSSAANLRRWSS